MFGTAERLIEDPSLDEIVAPSQRAFFEYWRGLPRGKRAPSSKLWNPLDLPVKFLPQMGIIKIEGTPPLFFVHLAGTAVVDAVGHDFTGAEFTSVQGSEGALKRSQRVYEHAQPYLWEGPLTWSHRDYKQYSTLALPFENDDGEIVMILQAYEFF